MYDEYYFVELVERLHNIVCLRFTSANLLSIAIKWWAVCSVFMQFAHIWIFLFSKSQSFRRPYACVILREMERNGQIYV